MRRSEIASQALVLATIIAIVVGAYHLLPFILAERYTPVVLQPQADADSARITVSVSGEASRPGIYSLDADTSLTDIIRIASDEGTAAPCILSLSIERVAGEWVGQRVDLNHADAWLLDALPGIGPDRARAIVDFRDEHGPFTSTDELTMVPGIGSTTYEGLKEFVTVTPA